jgi:hypothetical protein
VKRTYLELYVLAVCFVAVACFVVTLCANIYSIIRMAAPEFSLNSAQFERYQSNDTFWDFCIQDRTCSDEDEERPPEEELTDLRKEWLERALATEEHMGIQFFVKTLVAMLLEILVFGIHWWLGRRLQAGKLAGVTDEAEAATEKKAAH